VKIVYFNYLYDLYEGAIGSTIKAVEIMSALEKQGHEVKIYWMNKKPENGNGKLSSKLRCSLKKRLDRYLHEPNQILKNLKHIYRENEIIKRENPDIVISRLDVYLFSSLVLTRVKKIPWLLEADGPGVYEGRRFFTHYKRLPWIDSYIETLNLKFADKVWLVSNASRDYFEKKGVLNEQMHVIPNGVDPGRYNPNIDSKEIKQRYNLQEKVVIGFIGSFHYWHGVENLIALIDKVLLVKQDVRFLLVGQGGAKEKELRDFVSTKGYEECVIFTGYVPHDEIPPYISVMDIVVAPYPKLDFFYYSPMKIYEYMACGKAVVASKIGQIEEIIKDGHDGILVEPDNIAELSDRVFQLVDNPKLRATIGTTAWNTVLKNHTWSNRAARVSQICENIVSKKYEEMYNNN